MNKIEIGKTYNTRNRLEVRIFMTDGGGVFPIIGAYKDRRGVWHSSAWSETGKWCAEHVSHRYDLIEVKPVIEKTVWVNLYSDGMGFPTSKPVDNARAIARTKVTLRFEEGRFDD